MIFVTMVFSTPREKEIFDLLRLIFCPEELQNRFRHSIIVTIWLSEASANKIRSSTKKRWDSGGPRRERFIGFHFPSETTWLMTCPSRSMHKTNKYGEMESPWRIPLFGQNHSSLSPFQMIDIRDDSTHFIIFLVQELGNSMLSRVSLMKLQDNRS